MGYGGKSRRVGTGQQTGRDCRHDRPNRTAARPISRNLVHLDATIRLFAPRMEPKTIPAKRIRQSDLWFEQGELPRRVLDALRRAGEPIRAPDLARAVMIDKGLDPADRPSFVRVQWKVRDTLNRLNKRGLLASDGAGHGVLWRISDQAA